MWSSQGKFYGNGVGTGKVYRDGDNLFYRVTLEFVADRCFS